MSTVPALGPLRALPRRRVAVRAAALVALLVAALVVRATGILHPDDGTHLPPVDGAATVLPGVLRSGPPTETDLVLLRDTFAVRAVVVVGAASVEEQAVVPALGLRLLRLDVADGAAPTPEQVRTLRDLVAAGGGTVLLHDDTGSGPVVVTAAMLQLAVGIPLDTVLAGLGPAEGSLTGAQLLALHDAAATPSTLPR